MIKKAIILTAGLGTRLLPLSKATSKELLPLADKPIIHYLIKEVLDSGLKEIVFVVSPGKKEAIFNYLKSDLKLEKILKVKKRDYFLEQLKNLKEITKNLSYNWVFQKETLGDGQAILSARKVTGHSPCAVVFNDDIVVSKIPCLSQLLRNFKTCQKPIVALKKISKDKLSYYGIVQVEKIASRLYKIKKIVEKPLAENAPSNLAIVGRYIITPEVFDYLRKCSANKKGEIILAEVLEKMLEDGKVIYGYEVEGDWLECGDIFRYIQSNVYFSLFHSKFSEQLRKFLGLK